MKEVLEDESGGLGHDASFLDHGEDFFGVEGGESRGLAVEVDGGVAGGEPENEACGALLHAAFGNVVKDLPGEVCGGVKAGEFGVEPRLLMEFAQHGFGGCFA